MVRHEASYRLSQPLPLGAALMLLAKCPVVAKAFTLKISSSKQAATTARNDGIGFRLFVGFSSELRPWFTGTAMSNRIVRGEILGPAQDGGQSKCICQECFHLICGKLGFGWSSHDIPVRFYLFNLLACLLCKTVFTIKYLLFCCREPSHSCSRWFTLKAAIKGCCAQWCSWLLYLHNVKKGSVVPGNAFAIQKDCLLHTVIRTGFRVLVL